ncbi:MAG: PglZ domain-containing protein [Bacteroidales bacterium]|nr:PglZ domain-containing protein [Bacteroidales bacterium]MCM1147062.1 PglZ domain-containing protein [Bacteroidales bacterium]MCM1205805.1 PglZ domain-containing protein [Bacillota bacterium]MCM1509952.1 PglZ domain-containing protein [Clostridium sp.]
MTNGKILWADDEIELLRAHIIFLEKKDYEVITVSNGTDAIEQCQQQTFDLILLDEMMPGITGLETLQQIKDIQPQTPVVMVTKSEEENIMNQAIGQKIADYLIKPVNPLQILLTLKKHIHRREIVTEVTQTQYQQSFGQLSMQIMDCRTLEDWKAVYHRLVLWELDLSETDSQMTEMLASQKEEANIGFSKFIKQNYMSWVNPKTFLDYDHRPLLSPDIFREYVFPVLDGKSTSSKKTEKVFFIVVDNFRYDQWRILSKEIGDMFDIDEDMYLTILPTATQYARNAIFSGLMPEQIERMFSELWVDEDSPEGKNLNEEPLIRTQIERYRRKYTFSYNKVNDSQGGERFLDKLPNLSQNDLNVLVVNFIDMLSHARTESKMVRELANNESAYRSITLSWFRHSVLAELFRVLAQSDYRIILTTDHGSIRCNSPVKIIGDKNTNTNLRYKLGKNLNVLANGNVGSKDKDLPRDLFVIKDPAKAQLPSPNLSTNYVFATGDSFFAYPNNYNYYVSYFKDTFQHGGISMEEMLVPIITLKPRKR